MIIRDPDTQDCVVGCKQSVDVGKGSPSPYKQGSAVLIRLRLLVMGLPLKGWSFLLAGQGYMKLKVLSSR